MAPVASPASPFDTEQTPATGEWQALRGELVALLDQVEGRFVRIPGQEPGYDALAQRMQALRHQVSDVSAPATRHQEALRSVQRAVDRFNERGEPLPTPSNPQDMLQSAIKEIRGGARMSSTGMSPRQAAPRLDEFASAVHTLSSRLGQIETELRSHRAGAQSIKEVAEQVGQLTHVVELLAGAVGETGQVKRLEGQIASLAQMIDQGARIDLSALTMRLDDVSATVERLADMQAQQVAAPASAMPALEGIETSLRNVYDRIDTLERSLALPSAELDRLTETVGQITAALQREAPRSEKLLGLVDDLNQRIAGLDPHNGEVGALKLDVAGLRDAVMAGLEPRFSALEMQIEALSDRVDAKEFGGAPGIAEQIRQLIARMDDTGAQIAQMASLYGNAERAEPDYERLADAMAARAPVAASAIDEFATIRDDMSKVDDRLERLEAMLTGKAVATDVAVPKAAAPVEAMASAPAKAEPVAKAPAPAIPEPAKAELPPKPVSSLLEAASEPVVKAEKPAAKLPSVGKGDLMPANPADDMPLVDQGFTDPSPVKAALDAKTAARKPHPGLGAAEAEPVAASAPIPERPIRPSFDPLSVERPPRPESSLASGQREVFASTAPEAVKIEAPQVKTSTFIEAARRATQRQAASKADASSLIGRALARFQPTADSKPAAEKKPEPAPKPEAKVKPAPKKAEGRRSVLGRKPKMPDAEKPVAGNKSQTIEDVILGAELEPLLVQPKKSFLERNSKVILLACSVIALSVMAANLFVQRMNEAPAADQAAPVAEPAAAPADVPTPVDTSTTPVSSLPPNDLVMPVLDETATGSIDPSAALSFAAPTSVASMPEALQAASLSPDLLTSAPEVSVSPVKVELPPAEIGPEAMREAAANGDPRAQFEIAAIYSEGRIVPEDFVASAKWYERAAAQGFAPAQYRLGNLYENGKGVPQDLEQARLWYQRAAEAGNRMSMHNLAALYAGGNLGKQEFAMAAEWFEQAAARGMTDSQFNLGMLYARGLGVPQDMAQSYKWFSLAAAKGDGDAAKARDDVAASLDATAVAQVKAEIATWQPIGIDLAANFAPIGTWSETFDPGQAVTNAEVVKKVQAALVRLGYDLGTPDGVYGPKTGDAIRAFERGTGMSESGQVNPRLLAVLGSQPV